MGETRRFNLTLFLSSPLHREAWELLRSLPAGQRTEYVCRAVCRMQDQEAVLDAVRAVIQGNSTEKPKSQPRLEKVSKRGTPDGEVGQEVLDFLKMLQDGGMN